MNKTSSKTTKENIRKYIIEHYDGSGYSEGTPEAEAKTFDEIARVILADVKRVKGYEVARNNKYTWVDAFCDWCAGLPSLLDTCYYYNRSAVDDLGAILDETEEERNRFTEEQAERLLSQLIYRELTARRGF